MCRLLPDRVFCDHIGFHGKPHGQHGDDNNDDDDIAEDANYDDDDDDDDDYANYDDDEPRTCWCCIFSDI